MNKPISILLLEDSALDAELIREQVRKSGVRADIQRVIRREEFENALAMTQYDLILSDYALPDFDGLSALNIASQKVPDTPFIFVSGTLGEDVAIDSLQNGATDYVVKQRLERLAPAISRAIKEKNERELRRRSQNELKASETRFRELADAMPQLVWTTDHSGKITYCNRHAKEYAGFVPINLSPPGIEITHPKDKDFISKSWETCLASDKHMEVEYRLRSGTDGNYRWHLARFVPMRKISGEIEGWIATAVDIEEQKRREQALLHSEAELMMAKETLEEKVRERSEAYQKLSARILHIQDLERRKIARELHDGLGQYMSALKINLDILHESYRGSIHEPQLLLQSINLLHSCISEARTTSYLLHPPMLDEAGFAMAASWYVDGYGERSRIKTKLNLPEDLDRLPEEVEVVLFRVLQESLTNVHRHAKSSKVDITVAIENNLVSLEVRDYGCGIPQDRLQTFHNAGSGVGVGLAGMRERVRELGGVLEVTSSKGTTIKVTIPLTNSPNEASAIPAQTITPNTAISA